MSILKKGTEVFLKTPGPAMVVHQESDESRHGYTVCVWFNKDQERKEGEFAEEALEDAAAHVRRLAEAPGAGAPA